MIKRFFPLLLLLLLLLVTAMSVARGHPLVVVSLQHDNVDILGRADNCKSVSIPAKSVCAPGLVCNPSTGTCVPVGHHLRKYHLDKMFAYSKLPFFSSNNLEKSSLTKFADKVPNSAWL